MQHSKGRRRVSGPRRCAAAARCRDGRRTSKLDDGVEDEGGGAALTRRVGGRDEGKTTGVEGDETKEEKRGETPASAEGSERGWCERGGRIGGGSRRANARATLLRESRKVASPLSFYSFFLLILLFFFQRCNRELRLIASLLVLTPDFFDIYFFYQFRDNSLPFSPVLSRLARLIFPFRRNTLTSSQLTIALSETIPLVNARRSRSREATWERW
ncbi:hypothetical protein ALC60_03684 [Trachymyrmex zeteki]|uniref:Uncharacterized protein n=1 Tax=Mycetomoellerius zeteki TaxID=64791 RepID=A0A151XAH5_9HYME|nr:hypothetical protein ALC60_03684 [Trachymyrmex zeteki]